ncbi:Phosphoesterase family [Teratosphaeria destructans]|uniref:Phosphoesterase family n=1 Tax=Teratosphaeria destructans TaxID=418781 RepID=A0A9W7SNA8_9PEZI|nr:Phosphoesterase family [Teratosphaeria destructans]
MNVSPSLVSWSRAKPGGSLEGSLKDSHTMAAFALGMLVASAAAAAVKSLEPDAFTATATKSVYAAQATAATYEHNSSYVPGRVFDRFITIWMENTDYSKAAEDPNLAWLAQKGITLENYFGVTHPSEPNYCASHGGDNFGMDNDAFNQIDSKIATVTDLLEDRGISWGSYQEDMPYTGYEGYSWVNTKTGANDYVRKHNPPVLYDVNTSPRRLSYQKNTTLFYEDLAAKRHPQWMFITPNMTDDGHDTSVTVAGAWMRNFVEPLLNDTYFMDRTLILVTFDETETYTIGNRVFSILLGGAVKGKENTSDASFYNHYSEIATVEANWDLHTLGRWDVGANVFKAVAETTGDQIRPFPAATGANATYFYNSSFAGPFNEDFEKAGYPAPNIHLVGRSGRTVLPSIHQTWANATSTYYSDTVVVPDGQHPPPGYAYNDVSN